MNHDDDNRKKHSFCFSYSDGFGWLRDDEENRQIDQPNLSDILIQFLSCSSTMMPSVYLAVDNELATVCQQTIRIMDVTNDFEIFGVVTLLAMIPANNSLFKYRCSRIYVG